MELCTALPFILAMVERRYSITLCRPEMDQDIIHLEDGYRKVYQNGIQPFINLIESREREFVKAHDFVQIYE